MHLLSFQNEPKDWKDDDNLRNNDYTSVNKEPRYDTIDSLPRPPFHRGLEYRGFLMIPLLNTHEGREEFYKGEDRGVSKAEDPANYRSCSTAFIDSLWKDYARSFQEFMLSNGHKDRGAYVHKATEREFERLQSAPELFTSEIDYQCFRHKLVEKFKAQQECKKITAWAIENCKRLEEEALEREKRKKNTEHKPNLAPWDAFLRDGAPGVPTPWSGQLGLFSHFVPTVANMVVNRWNDEIRQTRERIAIAQGLNRPASAPPGRRTHGTPLSQTLEIATPLTIRPNPFKVDLNVPNNGKPLSLVQVNRRVAQNLGEIPRGAVQPDRLSGAMFRKVRRSTIG